MDFIKRVIKEKNYWPHTIVGMIIGIVIAIFFTIKIAINNPVQEENIFMDTYQNVNENINNILLSQSEFMKKYEVEIINEYLKFGENSINIKVLDKTTKSLIENADIKLLVTRPETREYDQKLENLKYENGVYIATPINIVKEGRWFIMPQIKVEQLTFFQKLEYNGTKIKNFTRIN